jgi:hypothetical protein
VSDLSRPESNKSLAEYGEEFAAGRTGAACPFCTSRATRIHKEEDRTGLLSASWECANCDESGPCLADGTFVWEPEGEAR